MATLASLRERIEKLQQEAEKLRKSELSDVIARIRAEVAEYDLSPEDIFGGKGKRGPRGKKAAAKESGARAPRPPKFRDPKTGKTWNGVGKPPVWIAGARNRDKFLIDASDATAEEGTATPSSAPVKKAGKAAVSRSGAKKLAAKKASKRGAAKKMAEESPAAADSDNGGAAA
jgi:DNA-binding protein H-NS